MFETPVRALLSNARKVPDFNQVPEISEDCPVSSAQKAQNAIRVRSRLFPTPAFQKWPPKTEYRPRAVFLILDLIMLSLRGGHPATSQSNQCTKCDDETWQACTHHWAWDGARVYVEANIVEKRPLSIATRCPEGEPNCRLLAR